MRRRSRECALQILYQLDIGKHLDSDGAGKGDGKSDGKIDGKSDGKIDRKTDRDNDAPGDGTIVSANLDQAIAAFWGSFSDDDHGKVDRELTERLVRGVVGDLLALDEAIAGVSRNWRVNRMGAVDRNLLRLAAYEILRCPDIPRTVSINEALEIAKRFGGDESRVFVNGILDQMKKVGEEAPRGG